MVWVPGRYYVDPHDSVSSYSRTTGVEGQSRRRCQAVVTKSSSNHTTATGRRCAGSSVSIGRQWRHCHIAVPSRASRPINLAVDTERRRTPELNRRIGRAASAFGSGLRIDAPCAGCSPVISSSTPAIQRHIKPLRCAPRSTRWLQRNPREEQPPRIRIQGCSGSQLPGSWGGYEESGIGSIGAD